MRSKLIYSFVIAALFFGTAAYERGLLATPASGFSGSTIAKGRFEAIDVSSHVMRQFGDATPQQDLWLSLQKTKGPSDLYVQNNLWSVGGSTGWHTHPGHSLIIVTEGAVTAYEGDDSSCTPKEYTIGMGFVDPGGDHVHLLRNEGAVPAGTVAVQLLPADAMRRIDAERPNGCLVF
jgi:hypothetical protein